MRPRVGDAVGRPLRGMGLREPAHVKTEADSVFTPTTAAQAASLPRGARFEQDVDSDASTESASAGMTGFLWVRRTRLLGATVAARSRQSCQI